MKVNISILTYLLEVFKYNFLLGLFVMGCIMMIFGWIGFKLCESDD